MYKSWIDFLSTSTCYIFIILFNIYLVLFYYYSMYGMLLYVECNHNLQAIGKAARKPVGTGEGLWFG